MKYTYEKEIDMKYDGKEWDKHSSKEVLQYAVGGLLYMPATNTKIANDILTKRHKHLKTMVLCLEDAIGDDMVHLAEESVIETLDILYKAKEKGEIQGQELPLIFARVRDAEQMGRLRERMDKQVFSMLTGFTLPKFDKTNCDEYIEIFTRVRESIDEPLYIMPILESKHTMYKQYRVENLMYIHEKLKGISENVLNIRVGATDFCSIFGLRRGIDKTIYDVRVVADCLADVVNVFGKNYVCSAPVWEYFGQEEGKWSQGLQRELEYDKLNGFMGKTCIHPAQLKHIQESYIVSYEEYADAISILGIKDGITGVVKGYGNNKMNEVKTHTTWAKRIIGMASVYGVKAEERG